MNWSIMHGSARELMAKFPARSIHAIATSVPFFLQRDYEVEGAFGQESTRTEWSSRLVEDMNVARDILRDDGTAFLHVGETHITKKCDLPLGDVSLQAFYLAEDLRKDGWSIKSMIVIHITNPAPTSPHNRPVQTHQYGILLAKSKNEYYYDYITSKEPGVAHDRLLRSVWTGQTEKEWKDPVSGFEHGSTYPSWIPDRYLKAAICEGGVCANCGAPRKAVVKEATGGTTGKSWLTHLKDGQDLVRGNAKTGSSKDYVPASIVGWKQRCDCKKSPVAKPLVLDPYTGKSSTGIAALNQNCMFVGIDLDQRAVESSRRRLSEHDASLPLFDSRRASRRQSRMFRA